jgi:chemotaxis protein CheZ
MTDTNTTYGRDQVLQIVNSVLEKVEPSAGKNASKIYSELKELKRIVDAARDSLENADADAIKHEHISAANEELNEIVNATAEATGTIMDSCERIEKQISKLDDSSANEIQDAITKIYEACSFQDITGQRIAKVTSSLGLIEDKVNSLLSVISDDDEQKSANRQSRDDSQDGTSQSATDDNLLNGPQSSGQGVTQDDIDSILAEFDDPSQS